MLTSKQRAYLRSLSSKEATIIMIGKNGISEDLIKSAEDALSARELVKGKVLESYDRPIIEVANELAELTQSELVQTIGRKFVLYRRKEKDSKIDITKIN